MEVQSKQQPLSVEETLDAFHKAASEADGETYFNLFATKQLNPSYFIGTDATERWTVDEFKNYAMPYFSQGIGWTYSCRSRHVHYSNDNTVAWFDEILDNARFGTARGSGVLVQETSDDNDNTASDNKLWRITQYHLTIPVPNALMDKTVQLIREYESQPQT